MSDVTRLLEQIEQGNRLAAQELLPVVYDELRSLASAKMLQEKSGQTLQATAVVHEAYLRLVQQNDADRWDSRGHFFAAAAEAMRRILVDRARHKSTVKRGGSLQRHELQIACPASKESPDRLVAIDEALGDLEKQHPEAAKVLMMRYFTGLSLDETAAGLGISPATAKRRWALARAFLYDRLESAD